MCVCREPSSIIVRGWFGCGRFLGSLAVMAVIGGWHGVVGQLRPQLSFGLRSRLPVSRRRFGRRVRLSVDRACLRWPSADDSRVDPSLTASITSACCAPGGASARGQAGLGAAAIRDGRGRGVNRSSRPGR